MAVMVGRRKPDPCSCRPGDEMMTSFPSWIIVPNLMRFGGLWWRSTWILVALFVIAAALMEEEITYEPGMLALCAAVLLIGEAMRSGRWLTCITTVMVIFGSYFGFVKDAKVAPTDPQPLVILALIFGASAFLGFIIAMMVFSAITPAAQQSQPITRRHTLVVVVVAIGLVLVLWLLSLL